MLSLQMAWKVRLKNKFFVGNLINIFDWHCTGKCAELKRQYNGDNTSTTPNSTAGNHVIKTH